VQLLPRQGRRPGDPRSRVARGLHRERRAPRLPRDAELPQQRDRQRRPRQRRTLGVAIAGLKGLDSLAGPVHWVGGGKSKEGDAGYARWKESTAFINDLKNGAKLTDGQVKVLEGQAKMFENSGFKVNTKEGITINAGPTRSLFGW